MKGVLHICNDFLGSKVHYELYSHLDDLEVSQVIFSPIRSYLSIEKSEQSKKVFKHSSIIYSSPLKFHYRVFFRSKINFLFNILDEKVNFENIQIVHATTLFSDGAVALKIYKKYKIPYIVAIRSTDIDIFMKYRPDLLFLATEILKYSQRVVFISRSLKNKFENHVYYKFLFKKNETKSLVINNGIADYWINNLVINKKRNPFNIIYIGSFLKRKNVSRLISAVINLQVKIPNIRLTLVGKGGNEEKYINELVKRNASLINHVGPIYDLDRLKEVFSNNGIFAMPSYNETFGLVFLEAISQGLPILYSMNEGIDGTFNENVGVAVDPNSIDSIESGLLQIINNYDSYAVNTDVDFKNFSWNAIACVYKKLYAKIQ